MYYHFLKSLSCLQINFITLCILGYQWMWLNTMYVKGQITTPLWMKLLQNYARNDLHLMFYCSYSKTIEGVNSPNFLTDTKHQHTSFRLCGSTETAQLCVYFRLSLLCFIFMMFSNFSMPHSAHSIAGVLHIIFVEVIMSTIYLMRFTWYYQFGYT